MSNEKKSAKTKSRKKTTKKETQMLGTIEFDGRRPIFPKEMFRSVLGLWDEPQTDDNGFMSIGLLMTGFGGISAKDGKFLPVFFIQHGVKINEATGRCRLIGPNTAYELFTSETEEDARAYATAGICNRDMLARQAYRMFKEDKGTMSLQDITEWVNKNWVSRSMGGRFYMPFYTTQVAEPTEKPTDFDFEPVMLEDDDLVNVF